MRQIVSTAVVAVIVGALAGATMSAVAQEPAEPAIAPAAGVNAASVDGKSAVGYTNKKNVRRGKLVATNGQGELPPNIVRPFWGYVQNKPGILADDQIAFGEVAGMPAGFADGVDNEGVTGIKIITVSDDTPGAAAAGAYASSQIACPGESRVVGGGHYVNNSNGLSLGASYPLGNSWFVDGRNNHVAGTVNVTAYALCLSTVPVTTIATANRSVNQSDR